MQAEARTPSSIMKRRAQQDDALERRSRANRRRVSFAPDEELETMHLFIKDVPNSSSDRHEAAEETTEMHSTAKQDVVHAFNDENMPVHIPESPISPVSMDLTNSTTLEIIQSKQTFTSPSPSMPFCNHNQQLFSDDLTLPSLSKVIDEDIEAEARGSPGSHTMEVIRPLPEALIQTAQEEPTSTAQQFTSPEPRSPQILDDGLSPLSPFQPPSAVAPSAQRDHEIRKYGFALANDDTHLVELKIKENAKNHMMGDNTYKHVFEEPTGDVTLAVRQGTLPGMLGIPRPAPSIALLHHDPVPASPTTLLQPAAAASCAATAMEQQGYSSPVGYAPSPASPAGTPDMNMTCQLLADGQTDPIRSIKGTDAIPGPPSSVGHSVHHRRHALPLREDTTNLLGDKTEQLLAETGTGHGAQLSADFFQQHLRGEADGFRPHAWPASTIATSNCFRGVDMPAGMLPSQHLPTPCPAMPPPSPSLQITMDGGTRGLLDDQNTLDDFQVPPEPSITLNEEYLRAQADAMAASLLAHATTQQLPAAAQAPSQQLPPATQQLPSAAQSCQPSQPTQQLTGEVFPLGLQPDVSTPANIAQAAPPQATAAVAPAAVAVQAVAPTTGAAAAAVELPAVSVSMLAMQSRPPSPIMQHVSLKEFLNIVDLSIANPPRKMSNVHDCLHPDPPPSSLLECYQQLMHVNALVPVYSEISGAMVQEITTSKQAIVALECEVSQTNPQIFQEALVRTGEAGDKLKTCVRRMWEQCRRRGVFEAKRQKLADVQKLGVVVSGQLRAVREQMNSVQGLVQERMHVGKQLAEAAAASTARREAHAVKAKVTEDEVAALLLARQELEQLQEQQKRKVEEFSAWEQNKARVHELQQRRQELLAQKQATSSAGATETPRTASREERRATEMTEQLQALQNVMGAALDHNSISYTGGNITRFKLHVHQHFIVDVQLPASSQSSENAHVSVAANEHGFKCPVSKQLFTYAQSHHCCISTSIAQATLRSELQTILTRLRRISALPSLLLPLLHRNAHPEITSISCNNEGVHITLCAHGSSADRLLVSELVMPWALVLDEVSSASVDLRVSVSQPTVLAQHVRSAVVGVKPGPLFVRRVCEAAQACIRSWV